MTPLQVKGFMVGFWVFLLSAGISALADEIGGVRAGLLTLLLLAGAQMGYGVLCRRVGKFWASAVLRLGPLLLMPGMLFSQGATADVLVVVLEVCNLVATLDWSDDDIGGWGRRRWAQVKPVIKRFSKPVMGGVTPRA
ncbi:hypothetical protein [Deinococcus sp. Leaf326]|uniref:hypothetical protein n=1 Tax=Deinococcus sp. Leaf326 TaxID=1736338 RepID=UPI0006F24A28|nr:hypothetical protein [Deinococcus sp. Leaf326]KQR03675.1 hypothetical protein ASF71_21345 [Deinococcus sp. Leaf326]